MKTLLGLILAASVVACASIDGRSLAPGRDTAADVERVMGAPAEKRQVGAETWYYYPRQPFGRQTYVARVGQDGRLIAVEPRLNDETLAKIVPNATTREQVRDLLGPPWQAARYGRLDRDIWTWAVNRWGNVGLPAQLSVQMSPDGVVREVLIIDEFPRDTNNVGVSIGFGRGL
jgi:outer membrane protein assembly factor BamE (lipoprotein component of BamABCDE complex)